MEEKFYTMEKKLTKKKKTGRRAIRVSKTKRRNENKISQDNQKSV